MQQVLSHTPVWVFFLFAALLAFGLLQSRDRSVKPLLAYVLPVGMIALSLAGVQSSFGFTASSIGFWAVGLVTVALIGHRFLPLHGVEYVPQARSFSVPGSWMPLLVIMAIFFTKYAVAVLRGFGSPLVEQQAFAALLSLAYGGFSGYFAARALGLIAAARRGAGASMSTPLPGSA